jgi:nucleoside-diphosphate-sugar epimerase
VGGVDGSTDWSPALAGVDAVIHLVARTHRPGKTATAAELYRTVNVAGTRRLAGQAREAGVDRLVYVSSIKAQAERADRPLREDDTPRPKDPYGSSKLEAEAALADALDGGATAYTIVRPPLVYGPGVQANLQALTRAVLAGWPLPFAWVDNRRSLIAVDNLADLLVHAMSHPTAANRLYLAADGDDLSTPELIRRIARAGGRQARLVGVPPGWLGAAFRLAGRGGLADRLLGSLQVETARVRHDLGWTPPISVDAGLEAMVAAIRRAER